jgi:hypothetical protein
MKAVGAIVGWPGRRAGGSSGNEEGMKFTKKMNLLFHSYPIKRKDLSNTFFKSG